MKILIINQVFYPDETAVSQYMTDFAESLTREGETVDVLAGYYDYERPNITYPKKQVYQGISIMRTGGTNFVKKSLIPRSINFLTYNIALFFRLLFTSFKQYDVIVGSSVPPMAPIISSVCTLLKRKPYLYWVMDLQPDAAIAMKLLKPTSLVARLMMLVSKIPLKASSEIMVLDRFMKEKIEAKGVPAEKVRSLSLWPTIPYESIAVDTGQAFREENGFSGKFVVMYSGNHSLCHPLGTILEAAQKLRDDPDILFVFIGSGVRTRDVADFVEKEKVTNIIQLPYQPRKALVESLCSADLHLAVMGDSVNGLMHPSKSYSIIATGRPFVFVGPPSCYINDLIAESKCGVGIQHGEVDRLVKLIKQFAAESPEEKEARRDNSRNYLRENLSRNAVIRKWKELLSTFSKS